MAVPQVRGAPRGQARGPGMGQGGAGETPECNELLGRLGEAGRWPGQGVGHGTGDVGTILIARHVVLVL